MTLKEVADYLSVRQPQAYTLVRSGELPGIKVGGRGVWRVDRRKLEEYIQRVTEETRAWVQEHPWTGHERPARRLRAVDPRPLPDQAEAVSAAEAARIIGVTRQNVNHLIRTGSLRVRKDGNRWLVSAEDARAYRALGQSSSADGGAPV